MDTYTKRFWVLMAVLTGLRLAFIGRFDLSPDEAYYWTWSRHLDWGYFDQGPMLALIIRAFTGLTGGSTEWSVRLGAVVLSCLSAWLFFELVRRCFASTRAAWLASVAMQSALLLSVGAVLMMHDSIMVCCWLGALLAWYRAICEEWQPGWWLGALALGLGGLAKFSMVLFVPCLLLFLTLSSRHRGWWRNPRLYGAGLIGLLLVSPVLIWNHSHAWASFGHLADLSGAKANLALHPLWAGEFLAGQLGVMTPLLGAFCLAAPFLAWRVWRWQGPLGEPHLFLACFSAPVLLFFFLLAWRSRVYANWVAPAYPACLAILAGWLESRRPLPQFRRWWAWAQAGLWTAAVLTLFVHLEVLVGWPPLPGRAADSLDRIRGWHALGQEAGRRLLLVQTQTKRTPFLAAQRYQIASVLAFYTPGQPEVQLLPDRSPAENQYRFWDHSRALTGQGALFVCEDGWEAAHLGALFTHVENLSPYQLRLSDRSQRELLFFRCDDFQPERGSSFARSGSGVNRP